jgi:hypothetical protein
MSHGIRVWGANGALQVDENSFTMRVVLTQVVSMGRQEKQTVDIPVPGANASNAIAVVLPIGTFADSTTQFETEMLDGVARVYNYNRGFTAGTWYANAGSMRLLVIRFA